MPARKDQERNPQRAIAAYGTALGVSGGVAVLGVGIITAVSLLPPGTQHHPRRAPVAADPHQTGVRSPASPSGSSDPTHRPTPRHYAPRPPVLALDLHHSSSRTQPAPHGMPPTQGHTAAPHNPAPSAPARPAPPTSPPRSTNPGCILTLELLNGVLVRVCI